MNIIICISFLGIIIFGIYDYQCNHRLDIIAASITGLITLIAVFQTSALDRKARECEKKYINYIDKLLMIDECINDLLNEIKIFKNKLIDPNNIDFSNFQNIDWKDISKVEKVIKIIKQLKIINLKWKNTNFDNELQDLQLIMQAYNQTMWYSQQNKNNSLICNENNIIKFSINNVLEFYKNSYDKDFNYMKVETSLMNLQNFINKELKMD